MVTASDPVLVAGVDTSTQSCKVVIHEAATGRLVRSGRAGHPDGTEVHPDHWWTAFTEAARQAGGLDDVSALSVGGQQHGMVVLDREGRVVREALLWNDTRSATAAEELVEELGRRVLGPAASREEVVQAGRQEWAAAIGLVPVASFTVTKLRWLRDAEPDHAASVAAVALPHDWLTWRIAGYGPAGDPSAPLGPDLSALRTDRSDASGTGYFDAAADNGAGEYRLDLLELALGRSDVILPQVVAPSAVAGVAHPQVAGASVPGGARLGPGAGDNAGAALGLGMVIGDVAVSIGTSGVVSAISGAPVSDSSGMVAGFADASGAYLPLAATLNASRILDAARAILGVSHEELSDLALAGPPGSDGLVLIPYLEGERTPNRPDATGRLYGLTLANSTRPGIARAFVEGLLCLLADGLDALRILGVPANRLLLIGGGAQSEAVRRLGPEVFGLPVLVPRPDEYVALGAARQAAWVLAASVDPAAQLPDWELAGLQEFTGEHRPQVRAAYTAARDLPEPDRS